MFNTLIDYWAYTGDESYNTITEQAIVHQVGDNLDFMPTNQTKSEGNDDQGFWAMTAMTAAEMNFTNPTDTSIQYLALAQAVFNEYVGRWDTTMCNGGLRWQIYTFNNGYNYKNSISNGCFFNVASRLARYTENATYAEWATKIFEWELGVGFIDSDWSVMDGSGDLSGVNCTEINAAQFTYNAGVYLHGAAFMYNYTSGTDAEATWKTRVEGLLTAISTYFFKDGVMWEPSCEDEKSCDTDQQSFKGHLARWMAMTSLIAPFTESTITPLLLSSAKAAALACSGTSSAYNGPSGTACGFSWLNSTFDDIVGVGEQMSALAMIISTLASQALTPYTSDTGGSSVGNADAGSSTASEDPDTMSTITTGDRVGAGILTAFILGGFCAGIYTVMSDWLD
jgi:mannan endo-1,6-alpha-mannosidase